METVIIPPKDPRPPTPLEQEIRDAAERYIEEITAFHPEINPTSDPQHCIETQVNLRAFLHRPDVREILRRRDGQ